MSGSILFSTKVRGWALPVRQAVRFKRTTAQIMSVPRSEIQKRELQWKNGRKQHKSHKRHR